MKVGDYVELSAKARHYDYNRFLLEHRGIIIETRMRHREMFVVRWFTRGDRTFSGAYTRPELRHVRKR